MDLDKQIARARKAVAEVKEERRAANAKQLLLGKTHEADRAWVQNRTQQALYTSRRLRMDVYYDHNTRPPMRITNMQSLLLGLSVRAFAESNLVKATELNTSHLADYMKCEQLVVAEEKNSIALNFQEKQVAHQERTKLLQEKYQIQIQAQRTVMSRLRKRLMDNGELLFEKGESLGTAAMSDESSLGSSDRGMDSFSSLALSVGGFLNFSQHGR